MGWPKQKAGSWLLVSLASQTMIKPISSGLNNSSICLLPRLCSVLSLRGQPADRLFFFLALPAKEIHK